VFKNNKSGFGGLTYFEKFPAQPNLVLKEIIKIAHPEL